VSDGAIIGHLAQIVERLQVVAVLVVPPDTPQSRKNASDRKGPEGRGGRREGQKVGEERDKRGREGAGRKRAGRTPVNHPGFTNEIALSILAIFGRGLSSRVSPVKLQEVG
jgi:hypothetical protein